MNNPDLLIKFEPDATFHTLVLLWKFDDGAFREARLKKVAGPPQVRTLHALTADWQQWPTMTREEFEAFKSGMGKHLGTIEKEQS